MKIVGVRSVEFEGKKDHQMVKGLNIYLECPFHSAMDKKYAWGLQTERVFVSGKVMNDLLCLVGTEPAELVGMEVGLVYNRYGKVCGFQIDDLTP